MSCPAHCEEKHERSERNITALFARSIPGWARSILIGSIAVLFGLFGSLYLYGAATYSTKVETDQLRAEVRADREMRNEINRKLDILLMRTSDSPPR